MIYTVTVAVDAVTAAEAAKLVQRKVEGRDRQRTAAVLRVHDENSRLVWERPLPGTAGILAGHQKATPSRPAGNLNGAATQEVPHGQD